MRLEKVHKIYHAGEVEVHALKDINLEIYRGEMLVILGPSGSGKTTLLNVTGGIDRPSSGSVFFNNEDLTLYDERQLNIFRRKYTGFVFQYFNLIPTLTALENVELVGEIAGEPLNGEDVLERVGLLDRKDHFPSQLSGGEQQRVSIARALAKNPLLLLCDEPTGSLDNRSGRKILRVLRDANKKQDKTVIIITHNTAIAEMADRIIKISSGRIEDIIKVRNPKPPEEIEW